MTMRMMIPQKEEGDKWRPNGRRKEKNERFEEKIDEMMRSKEKMAHEQLESRKALA
jgi:hypothetical protein